MLRLDKTPLELAEIARIEKRANSVYVASIISIFFCCLGGGIATYFAYQAKQDISVDNLDQAKRNVNIAMVIMVIIYAVSLSGIVAEIVNQIMISFEFI